MLVAVVFGVFFGTCAAACSCDFQVDWQGEFNRMSPELQSFTYPLEEPGKLFPGITTQGLISTTGKVWGARNVLVSLNMICRDIGPSLTLLLGPDTIGNLCDPIIDAVKDNAPVDGIGICNAVFNLANPTATRRKRQAYDYYNSNSYPYGIRALRPFDPLPLLDQVTRDLFGLTGYDQASVCTAFDQVLNDDVRVATLIEHFAREFLVLALPRGAELCNSWNDINNAMNQGGGVDPFFRQFVYFFYDLTHLIADMAGFSTPDILCQELTGAVASSDNTQLRALATTLVDSALDTLTTEGRCSSFFNSFAHLVVSTMDPNGNADIINPNVRLVFDVGSIDDVCRLVDDAFPPHGTSGNSAYHAEMMKAKRRRRAPRD